MPVPRSSSALSPQRDAPRWNALVPLAVFAAAIVPFLPAITAGFSNFDDPGVITENPGFRGLSADHLRWMFTTTQMGHYQPLTWLSYALEYAAWGLAPAGYHVTNIVLHAINAVLVYRLALALVRARTPEITGTTRLGASAAALLFAAHPLRVESVAWITERRDVLSTLFLLLTTLAYLRYAAASPASGARACWYVATVALLLCSLLSKAWGMSFFAVALILDWYPLGRLGGPPRGWFGRRRLGVLVEKAPFAILGVLCALQAAGAQASAPNAVTSLERWGLVARLCQAAYGLTFYVQKTLWPSDLAAIYELPSAFDPRDPRWIVGAIGAAALLFAAVACFRRAPAVTAAVVAYVVLVSPVLGLLQSGVQLVADRYSYVATIPLAVLAGAGVHALARRSAAERVRAVVTALGLIAVTLNSLSWIQTGYWRDTERLFAHALDCGQDGPTLREYYGRQLLLRGERAGALQQFDAAIRLAPGYGEAWFSSANVLHDLGNEAEAERRYFKAAELMPDAWRADVMRGLLYHAHANRLADAKAAFESAVARVEAPGAPAFSPRPYMLLAAVLDELGDTQGCRRMLEKAAQYDETRAEALEHLRDTPP